MRQFSLYRLFKNKSGLGAPVGNLIILAAAVVLSTTVVLYAVNVTSNQVQKENLYISNVQLSTDTALITVTNTGPTSIGITQITIKGDKFSNFTSSPDIANGLSKGGAATLTIILTENLITANDIGRPVAVVISTTQGAYFTETLVQATISEEPSGST